MKMKQTLLAIVLTLCLGLTACGGSAPAAEGKSDTQSAEATETETAPEAAAAEESTEAETAPEETKEPTVVDITMENWDQYFEILPVHAAYPYVMADDNYQGIITCNAFVFALKDEYFQDYLDNSGCFVSDKLLNSENYYWMYEDSILDSAAQKGDVSFPQGAEITATVSFQYDGDLLGADDNQNPHPDFTYTQEYTTADGPIEFERTVTIGNREYRYPVYYISLKEANLPEPSSGNAFDFTSTEVQTIDRVNVFSPNNSEILFNLTKGKINSPIVRVACQSSMSPSDADRTWEETGEILDHFTISMKDISGTLTLWK